MINRSFLKSVSVLFAGTAIAQIITFSVTPILSRVYTPEDFGQFATLLSIVMILSSAATAKYEMAIPLPKNDDEGNGLNWLSFLIAFSFCLTLVPVIGIFDFLGGTEAWLKEMPALWLWSIPLMVLSVSVFNILNYQNIRSSKYNKISFGNVTRSLSSATIQILYTLRFAGASGLVAGHFTGFVLAIFPMWNKSLFLIQTSRSKLKEIARKHSRFPLFSLPAGLANTLTLELNNIFLLILYSPEIVGFYSLAVRTLSLPLQLIGRSVAQVFYKDAIKETQENGTASIAFKRSFLILTLVAILIALVISFLAPWLYALVFGQNWEKAGEIAQLLMFLFGARLISSSLSDVLNVFGKQKTSLLINLLLFANILICYSIGEMLNLDFEDYLLIYSISGGSLYILFLLYYRKLAFQKKPESAQKL